MLHRKSDCVLSDHGLTSRGMSSNKHASTLLKPVYGTLLEQIKLKGIDNGLLWLGVPLIEVVHVLIINHSPLLCLIFSSCILFLGHLAYGVRLHIIVLILKLVDDIGLVPPSHIGMIEPRWLSLNDLWIVKVHQNCWLWLAAHNNLDTVITRLFSLGLLNLLLRLLSLFLNLWSLELLLDLENLGLLFFLLSPLVDKLFLLHSLSNQLVGIDCFYFRLFIVSKHLDAFESHFIV